MKLSNVILLSLSGAFLLISLYEMWALGLSDAYWSISLSIMFFFWYAYRKRG